MSEEETKSVNGVDGARLLSYIERYENIEGERKSLGQDLKELLEEAESNGFDKKAIKEIVKRRKKDKNTQQEEDFILDTYLNALNMQ